MKARKNSLDSKKIKSNKKLPIKLRKKQNRLSPCNHKNEMTMFRLTYDVLQREGKQSNGFPKAVMMMNRQWSEIYRRKITEEEK